MVSDSCARATSIPEQIDRSDNGCPPLMVSYDELVRRIHRRDGRKAVVSGTEKALPNGRSIVCLGGVLINASVCSARPVRNLGPTWY